MSIFSKFFEMIKKWFKPSKALPAPSEITEDMFENITTNTANITATEAPKVSESVTNEDRTIFTESLKVQKQEDTELLDLQAKFESNQIKLTDLTDEQLEGLNDLYLMQIDELKQTINKTKSEININMSKLESTSVSA